MSSDPDADDIAPGPSQSGPAVSDTLLASDVEPTADGGQRVLLYPDDISGAELSTRWIAARDSVVVDLDEVQ